MTRATDASPPSLRSRPPTRVPSSLPSRSRGYRHRITFSTDARAALVVPPPIDVGNAIFVVSFTDGDRHYLALVLFSRCAAVHQRGHHHPSGLVDGGIAIISPLFSSRS